MCLEEHVLSKTNPSHEVKLETKRIFGDRKEGVTAVFKDITPKKMSSSHTSIESLSFPK